MTVLFTKQECITVAKRYLHLSRIYARWGDVRRSNGYLNSAIYWTHKALSGGWDVGKEDL